MASPLVAAITSLEDKITLLEEKVYAQDFKVGPLRSESGVTVLVACAGSAGPAALLGDSQFLLPTEIQSW